MLQSIFIGTPGPLGFKQKSIYYEAHAESVFIREVLHLSHLLWKCKYTHIKQITFLFAQIQMSKFSAVKVKFVLKYFKHVFIILLPSLKAVFCVVSSQQMLRNKISVKVLEFLS